jgi:hypothetical protein
VGLDDTNLVQFPRCFVTYCKRRNPKPRGIFTKVPRNNSKITNICELAPSAIIDFAPSLD